MKASIEWLEEYANINVEAKKLGDILTMTGSKVETIESKGKDIKNVVVGKILEIEKHPDADKLIVTKVDVKEEILQIVTGANNVKVGDIVPIAKDGSELPGGVKIKTGKLRGVDSCGMMCSVGELNLDIANYKGQIEHGIMILPKEYESRLGEDIVEVLKLREDILDFEITPNRPDCLSIEGLGRETAGAFNQEFKNPRKNIDKMVVENKSEIEGLKVDIEAPDLCYRYIARMVKNIKIGESPEWMKKRLAACGVRSINNIVDITNYVMLEMGQPMHAFDINSIEGKHIIVRRAKQDEKIITLDEQERTLSEEMLVIADAKKPVAIAGVMGGQNSEIEKDTKTVVFESAVFNGASVRMTAKKVGLRTEASSRYEKGLSSENAIRAVNRAVELVELIGAGEKIDGMIDVYPTKQIMNRVELDVERINRLIGLEISEQEMISTLEKLGMKVENGYVLVPYFRMDIEQVADLAEEVLRFYGYDKLQTTLICADTTLGVKTKKQKIEDDIKQLLVDSGLSQICTYGFLKLEDLKKSNVEKTDEVIEIKNPLSEDYTIMRISTIPSMMQALTFNDSKKNKEVKLFDISRTYKNKKKVIEEGEVPEEDTIVTIGMYGKSADFYVLKGIVENIMQIAGVQRYDVIREENKPSYHPGKTASLKVGVDVVATFGEVHPIVLENYDISQKVMLAEINLDKIVKYAKTTRKYIEIPKFPALTRDIAIIVKNEIEVAQIEKIIQKVGKKLLEKLELFDVYRDAKLGEDRKSVAYALTFRIKERTLTDEEVNAVMEQIINNLTVELEAELRK